MDERTENTENTVSGVVTNVVYQNEQNGYAVMRVDSDDYEDEIIVVGSAPFIGVGENLAAVGVWTRHPTYGEQFRAELIERTLPDDETAMLAYLSGGAVKGIGPVTAKRIVDRFGEEAFDVIEHEPQKLAELPGITKAKAEKISADFVNQLGLRRLMEQLLRFSVHPTVALRLYKWYGNMAGEFVRDNPYMLTDETLGVPFGSADGMALELGFTPDSPARAEAGIIYELEYNSRNGHVYIPADKLVPATLGLLGIESEQVVREALDRLCDRGSVIREEISGLDAVYVRRFHEAESSAAARLLKMVNEPPAPPKNIERVIDRIAAECGTDYAPKQREAIRTAAESRVMLLTGGPGTGKTTSVRGMLGIFDYLGLKTVLCSPTGRAAKRLTELTGREALTVHRLLEVNFEGDEPGFSFVHNSENPLRADAVVLDETSMVDITLLAALLDAIPPEGRLVMVGDPDQLPSVGAGNVLRDLVTSKVIPSVELDEIFRQASESNIVTCAHAVNRGELPELRHKTGDLYFTSKPDPAAAARTVVELCSRRLPQNMGFESSRIQVLSPTRKGSAGTKALNIMLQNVLNPSAPDKPERKNGDYTFRTGDRVMHIRNNYDLRWVDNQGVEGCGVFNGDVGVIETMDLQSETLYVRYDERLATYPFELLDELEPAYAMTVHKAQGSEYPAVVLVACDAAPQLLSRTVLYTAMTRAQELLVIVGSDGVISHMVQNNRRSRRYTGLKYRLRTGAAAE